jgi:hypothetical protein
MQPSTRIPQVLPPIDADSVRALVSRREHIAPSDCWAAAKAANLHGATNLRTPLDELFSPRGLPPRSVHEVVRWVEAEERSAAEELENSFEQVRALDASLRAATDRARHAVSRSAWLYAARTAASARDFNYLS